MRTWTIAAALLAVPAWGQGADVVPKPAIERAAPVNYADPANWLCRPGRADACSTGLDAVAVDAAGRRTPRPFRPDPNAPVDCFYVYPTISHDPGFYSDMVPQEAEEQEVARAQAGLLGESCRVFAPLYRSITNAALGWFTRGGGKGGRLEDHLAGPYADVRAAWRSYLKRDNRGRGVVLVGHSQGAILLERLIAREIDGRPARRRLVAAYLAGNPELPAASFRTVPPCRSAGQAGCVAAWSSYLEGDRAGPRAFGGAPAGKGLCVDPAAPGGGRGAPRLFLPKPPGAPAGDPPFVETVGQLSSVCETDDAGAVLRVRIEPGVAAPLLARLFDGKSRYGTGWGLHRYDLSLVGGNLPGLVRTQAAAWAAGRR